MFRESKPQPITGPVIIDYQTAQEQEKARRRVGPPLAPAEVPTGDLRLAKPLAAPHSAANSPDSIHASFWSLA